jgi:hypothetical protein
MAANSKARQWRQSSREKLFTAGSAQRRNELLVLTEAEVEKWFGSFPKAEESVHCEDSELFYTHPEANCIDIEYPAKLESISFFARCVATLGYETIHFSGAMLWITQSGVWDDFDEGTGYKIIEAFRTAAGQPKSFEAAAAHKFRADELHQAIGSLLQPMIFGWDAIYYPSWSYGGQSEFFVHVSHDSFVSIVTRTKEFYDRAFAILRDQKLNPKAGHEMQVRRFCRNR